MTGSILVHDHLDLPDVNVRFFFEGDIGTNTNPQWIDQHTGPDGWAHVTLQPYQVAVPGSSLTMTLTTVGEVVDVFDPYWVGIADWPSNHFYEESANALSYLTEPLP